MANSVIDSKGRVWIPEEVLQRMGVCGPMTADVDEAAGTITVRVVDWIPAEDEWAYTPDSRAASARARKDVQEGRVFQLSEQDLIDYVNGEVAPA